jgi:hypothetical protein
MFEEKLGVIVFFQNWSGHRSGDPPPPIVQTRFKSRLKAEEYKDGLRQRFADTDAVVLCMAPAPAPRKMKKGRR